MVFLSLFLTLSQALIALEFFGDRWSICSRVTLAQMWSSESELDFWKTGTRASEAEIGLTQGYPVIFCILLPHPLGKLDRRLSQSTK